VALKYVLNAAYTAGSSKLLPALILLKISTNDSAVICAGAPAPAGGIAPASPVGAGTAGGGAPIPPVSPVGDGGASSCSLITERPRNNARARIVDFKSLALADLVFVFLFIFLYIKYN
jgi:hypothetical protein